MMVRKCDDQGLRYEVVIRELFASERVHQRYVKFAGAESNYLRRCTHLS